MKKNEYKCSECICRECVNLACKKALCDGAIESGFGFRCFDFHCFVEAYGNGSACFMSLSDLVTIQDEAGKERKEK